MSTSDASPGRELWSTLWTGYLRPWLDFRAYLRQRSVVLGHTTLEFPPEEVAKPQWKGPLAFALQGTVLAALVVGLATSVVGSVVRQRDTVFLVVERREDGSSAIQGIRVPGGREWSTRRDFLGQYYATLAAELEAISRMPEGESFRQPPPYALAEQPNLFMLTEPLRMAPVSRDEAIRAYRRELAALHRQFAVATLAPHFESAWKWLEKAVLPVALTLSAFAFSVLTQVRATGAGPVESVARRLYLYLYTARLFWVNLLWAFCTGLYGLLRRLFPGPSSMEAMGKGLDAVLREGDAGPTVRLLSHFRRDPLGAAYTLAILALAVAAYVQIRRVAKPMALALRLPAKRRWFHPYSGPSKVRKDLVAANLFSAVYVGGAAALLSLVWSVLMVLTRSWKL